MAACWPARSCRRIPAARSVLDAYISFEVRHVLNQFINHYTPGQASSPQSWIDRAKDQVLRFGRCPPAGGGRYQRFDLGPLHDHHLAVDTQTARLPENHEPCSIDVNDQRNLADSRFRLTPGALGEASLRVGIERKRIPGGQRAHAIFPASGGRSHSKSGHRMNREYLISGAFAPTARRPAGLFPRPACSALTLLIYYELVWKFSPASPLAALDETVRPG